jgi:signal peptidase II
MMGILPKYRMLLVIAPLIVIFDQVTKILILKLVPLHKSLTVIPGFLNITHIQNAGVAFGIFSQKSSNMKQLLLMAASLMAVCLIFYFYHKSAQESRIMMASFALIFGGAVGNFIDRARIGRVVDFIDVYIGDMHWPSFNVADSAISVGVVVLMFFVIFKKPELFSDREE